MQVRWYYLASQKKEPVSYDFVACFCW